VNIRHHRHQYHITTVTTMANTTDITIVKAIPPFDHRIISFQSRIGMCTPFAAEQHPPTTSI